MTCLSCGGLAVLFPKDQNGIHPLCYDDYRTWYETGFVPKPKPKSYRCPKGHRLLKVIKMNINQKLVADYLVGQKAFSKFPGIHRSRICADLDMKWSTAYDTLNYLIIKGIVKKFRKRLNGKRGRPKVFYCLTTEEF